ncbi:MAG TPA: metallophosphoesterase family protein [bacterium]|nr:metallophosphoesterase family protein [bacterium]HPN42352.1 metallophosphoesterase family protein [bacterium]
MKKIAVLADIHGNVAALTAVLQDLQRRHVDTIINLGDVLYGPLAPQATFALVQSIDMITISGNEDRLITAGGEENGSNNPTMQFVRNDLDAQARRWLQELPFDKYLDDELYLCHGTPQSDRQYLLEDVSAGYPALRSEAELLAMLRNVNAPVILCGHSHLQHVVQLSDSRLVVNPGSVGLPAYRDDNPIDHAMENYSPHAGYALLEKAAAGWQVELLRIPYHYGGAATLAMQHNRPDWAVSLVTGRV